jgi:predicted AlkP superfamily phosphohydrolase/phosphomutase
MAERRVVLVALDAMEIGWMRRLTSRGDLPNLAAFLRECHGAAVRSDGGTLHGSIWPTFALGKGPGHHGRYWWLQWLAEEMRYVRNSHPAFDYRPFWLGLAEAGKRVSVVDIPYAPLARHALVEQVIGWGTHDEVEQESWPGDALERLRREYGRHPLSFDMVEPHSAKDRIGMAEAMAKGVAMRARQLERLAGDASRDFVLVVFSETHKAGHYLAEEREIRPGVTNLDLMARVLRPLDEAWPRVLAAAGNEATVALFALHGMQHQVDFSALGGQVLALALGREAAAGVARPDLLRRIRDLVPDGVHRFAWQRLPAGMRAAREGALNLRAANPGDDPVFRVGHDGDFALRLSIAGREARGTVEREAGKAWLDRIEELANGFRTREGTAVFAGAWRTTERLSGPRLDRLPDALLVSNRELARVAEAVNGSGQRLVNPLEERRNGVHTGTGFCFVRPPAGRSLELPAEVDARDFAPTVFSLLGLEPPRGFEGRSFLP